MKQTGWPPSKCDNSIFCRWLEDTTLTQKSQDFLVKKSWHRLVTSVGADWIRWTSRALWGGAEVPGLVASWDTGRISQFRPKRRFPDERPALSTLETNFIHQPNRGQLILFITYVSMRAFVKSEGFQENRESVFHKDPFPDSSVHLWSLSLPLGGGSVVRLSSFPLLLLPLFYLCSLSSNSIAILEL